MGFQMCNLIDAIGKLYASGLGNYLQFVFIFRPNNKFETDLYLSLIFVNKLNSCLIENMQMFSLRG